ncbi:hypothetical protein [Wolbachia endosymbiont (group A) of Ennomos erosarius]|uniref:hypothetical protein n=1 Tax=Wolbachia endosymbiont (group A) of Ennomos erosarius TaxID=3066174 RepID=UPI003341ADA7
MSTLPKQPDHLNVDAAKSDLMSLSENKDTETPSLASEPAKLDDVAVSNLSDENSKKEENGQGWFAWSLGKAKSAMTEVVVIGADVTKPYFAKVTKALAT